MVEIFLLVIFLVAFLSVIKVVYSWNGNKNSIYLAAFLIILSIEGLNTWLFYSNDNTLLFTWLFNHTAPLFTLKAPLLFFFVRGNLRDNFALQKTDWWHVLPAILHFLFIIPYILTPFDEKFQIVQSIQQHTELYPKFDLGYPYPHLWNHYFRSIQLIIYGTISIVYIFRFMSRASELSGELRRQYRFSSTWLLAFLFLIGVVGLIHLLTVSQAQFYANYAQATKAANHIFTTSISVYALIPLVLIAYPRFLYGFPAFKFQSATNGNSAIEDETITGEPKIYPRKVLQNIDELYLRITEHMETEKPYLNKDFKLLDLAIQLNVPIHHLQLCISQKTEKKFADFNSTLTD